MTIEELAEALERELSSPACPVMLTCKHQLHPERAREVKREWLEQLVRRARKPATMPERKYRLRNVPDVVRYG